MTGPRIIRFATTQPSRWANGLGETVELWRTPTGGDFAARLSIATVGEPAAFSPLPGVARALMALAPAGLVLTIDGARVALARYGVAAFDGGQEVAAVEVPEPGYDLNLMVRGGVPSLAIAEVDGRIELPAGTVAAVAVSGELTALGTRLSFGDAIVEGTAAIRGIGRIAIATIAS